MSTEESLIPPEAGKLVGTEQARATGIVEKKQFQRDVVTATRQVDDITQKHGRSGRFVLVTWLAAYRNQDDVLVAEARSSMIARP